MNDPRDAAIAAVLDLHSHAFKAVEPWAAGYRFSNDHCARDGQPWPCDTVRAINDHLENTP